MTDGKAKILSRVTPWLLIDNIGPRRGAVVAAALILAVAAADYATGYAVRLSILYLVPIALATWVAGTAMGTTAAALSSLLWLFSFRSEHLYQHQAYYFWEAAVMFCGFAAFVWLIARLRRALSQADERFFTVIEAMRAAVYVADERRDEILYANPEMARIAGAAEGLRSSDVLRAFEPVAVQASCLAPDEGVPGGPSETLKDPRTGRWYVMRSGTIPWGSNPDVRLRVLTDITERKNAELLREKNLAMVHQAAQLTTLAEIASTLAHEINQPLMVIATYTDACKRLLEAQDFQREEVATALDKCHAQAVRAASILERLREFIRQRQHRPVPCEAKAIILDALDVVRPLLDEEGIEIGLNHAVPDRTVAADRVLMVQVLVNLIHNAVDAMRGLQASRRRLTLAVSAPDPDQVVFSVADCGAGVAAAVAEKIFSPFYTSKPDGMGLGLSICHSVAEAHGGRLWFANNPEGGATFFLSLPASMP